MLAHALQDARQVELFTYPVYRSAVPPGSLRAGRYALRFARDVADLRAVQRLRYEVFNLELDEGLDSAHALGSDADDVDASCHHLMVIHAATGAVVGTYRLMLRPMAQARGGFYSESEYDLAAMPASVLDQAVELGRACVAKEHRNGRVIHLLWRGLARYLAHNAKRYLFGCCSLPTLDPAIARRAYAELRLRGHVHPEFAVAPRPELAIAEETAASPAPFELPPLFSSYVSLGAKVCSGPALDRAFKVTDFLVLLDLEAMDPRVRQSLMSAQRWDGESA